MLIHPIAVHFPIAFYLLSVLLLAIFGVTGKAEYERFSFLVLGLGFLGALAALGTGLWDAGGFAGRPVQHSNFAFAFSAVYAVLLLIRWRQKNLWMSPVRYIYLALVLAGLLLVCVTGFLGGELVNRMVFG